MNWVIPHPDAAGTLYNASDDYKWFRLIVGFERAACSNIDTGDSLCGQARLFVTGDGQFSQIVGSNTISSTDQSSLQTVTNGGSNKIAPSVSTLAAADLYRGVRQSDSVYRYTSLFVDLRTCWRIGQALSKLTIKGEALIEGGFQDFFGTWVYCTGCFDVFTAWQTDWISADLMTVTPIDDGSTLLSRTATVWSTLFSFDMDPDGAAI